MNSIELIDIIGVGIVLIVLIELIILSINLLIKYNKNTNEKLPIWFALLFIFLAGGILFLILQQLTFRIIINFSLGRTFTWIALISTGTAAFFLNYISIVLTYPQIRNKLIIPILIIIIFLVVSAGIWILVGEPFSYIKDGELFYMTNLLALYYILAGILCFIAPTVFVYFAIMNKENKSARNRGIWLAFALYLFGFAYLMEVGPIVSLIAVPIRVTYIITTTILYIQFTRKPEE